MRGAGSSPREGGEHIPREGGEQISHSVTDGFFCERHSERVAVRDGGEINGLEEDIKSIANASKRVCPKLFYKKGRLMKRRILTFQKSISMLFSPLKSISEGSLQ